LSHDNLSVKGPLHADFVLLTNTINYYYYRY